MTPEMRRHLQGLANLPANWDLEGGKPIYPSALGAAAAFLETLTLVPLSNGGVQIEAHALGIDLEIEVSANEVRGQLFSYERPEEPYHFELPPE